MTETSYVGPTASILNRWAISESQTSDNYLIALRSRCFVSAYVDDDNTRVDHDDGYVEENKQTSSEMGSSTRLFMASRDNLDKGHELFDEICALDPMPQISTIECKERWKVSPVRSFDDSTSPTVTTQSPSHASPQISSDTDEGNEDPDA